MPVLKIYKDGKWEDISGLSEHTHVKSDITDLQEKVYTQPDEPVDAPIGAVWFDTDEDVGFGGASGGGSASIDVTASIGQTIVVEEVDANGKPTKWKAAEYQPRTHWSEEGLVQVSAFPVYQTKLDSSYGVFAFMVNFNEYVDSYPLTAVHSIKFDGVEYTDLATVELGGYIFFGNLYFLNASYGTSFANTGEPFILAGNSYGMMILTMDTENTRHTLEIYINGTKHHRLGTRYRTQIPVVDLTGYYSGFPDSSIEHVHISGDNYHDEVYEILRKNDIVELVCWDADGELLTGCCFTTKVAGLNNIYLYLRGYDGREIRINAMTNVANISRANL